MSEQEKIPLCYHYVRIELAPKLKPFSESFTKCLYMMERIAIENCIKSTKKHLEALLNDEIG